MKPAPTLIDELYRLSFNKETIKGWRSNIEMRRTLESARRFIADERMSSFMADLSNESFKRASGTRLCFRLIESLRTQARLPHETIWIEYALHPYQLRSHIAYSGRPTDEKTLKEMLVDVPTREGWLIQQHPAIPTACMMHAFIQDERAPDAWGYDVWTFPLAYAWVNDDSPLPWRLTVPQERIENGIKLNTSEQIVGLYNYESDAVGCVRSPLIIDPEGQDFSFFSEILTEWMGIVRRAWALLATIDHLPLGFGEVRQSKGFLARGRIRKFLSHQTITLNVPAKKDVRVIARQAIAQAHRKRHEVRGHWRDDWRNPPSKRCAPHLWVTADDQVDTIVCELCRGRQFYIHKHERGDASLGYVTHDYVLKHEKEKADG